MHLSLTQFEQILDQLPTIYRIKLVGLGEPLLNPDFFAMVAAARERIAAAGGRITFAEFMELALYHPKHGYYLGITVRSAREGDFLTAVLEDERPSREPFDALHHRPLHEAEPDELRAQDALRQAMDARGISFGDGAEFHWVPFRAGAAFLHSPHSP